MHPHHNRKRVATGIGLMAIAAAIGGYLLGSARPALELRLVDSRVAPDGTRFAKLRIENSGNGVALVPGPFFVDPLAETEFGVHGEVQQVRIRPGEHQEVTARFYSAVDATKPWRLRLPFVGDGLSAKVASLARAAARSSKFADTIIPLSFRAFHANGMATSHWIHVEKRLDPGAE